MTIVHLKLLILGRLEKRKYKYKSADSEDFRIEIMLLIKPKQLSSSVRAINKCILLSLILFK